MTQPLDPVEGVLAVLATGSASGTNKFGLLLALIDLAPSVPESGFIPDAELAAKLVELHWDHARPCGGHELRQFTRPPTRSSPKSAAAASPWTKRAPFREQHH